MKLKSITVILMCVAVTTVMVFLMLPRKSNDSRGNASDTGSPGQAEFESSSEPAPVAVARSEHPRVGTEGANNATRFDDSFPPINTSLTNLKGILDRSMAEQQAVYFSHQEISTPGISNNTVSFIYFRNQGSNSDLPTIEEVAAATKRSEDMRVGGQSLMLLAQQQKNNEMAQQAAGMLVEADRHLAQEDRFYTVEVARNTNLPPVVMFHAGIAEWLAYRNKALSLAQEHLGEAAQIVSIERCYIGGRSIFVAANSRGENVFIDPKSQDVFRKRDEVSLDLPPLRTLREPASERAERIRAQWQEFSNYGIDFKAFSLDGLVDLSKQR